MKWALYQYDAAGTRVLVAAFNDYATAFEAHSRFIDANPTKASKLVFSSEV